MYLDGLKIAPNICESTVLTICNVYLFEVVYIFLLRDAGYRVEGISA